jgi:hypothetical protein
VAALSDLAGRHRPQPAAQLGDRTGAAVPASSVAFVGEGLA